ncbi:helix-hairpin-helix domain-containing protein [Sporolactobacillus sp. STSJ-5]|uniref:helix-hairpin-helix domain-containing protein n=1 Tax=Sporolactobacillus sp. STSJ-5 TaxID=2965076 RepID=UPI00210724A4|nr:helix-hairpin-helix domain-containing protein [Sporolactobacillus sp. STSJ-5]MCQ2008465.1 helix-hairpin-helix domain-containing protein [Sporolactobacillus sp. STSJ-5]
MSIRWMKKKIGLIVLAVAVLLVLWFFYQHQAKNETEAELEKSEQLLSGSADSKSQAVEKTKQEPERVEEFIIDVKGAVREPGIYHVQTTDRVIDAIEQAGGFSKQADRDKVNLAQKLTDEMVIYVPKQGEKEPNVLVESTGNVTEKQESGEMVHVNTADEQTMQNLPGVGPAKAKAIIHYREEHGPFKSVDELTNVSGIGDKSLEKMKPNISLQ